MSVHIHQKIKRAELHTHLGSSVDPVIMWSIAHRQGIKLPAKEFWEFEDMITMSQDKKNTGLEQMDKDYFHLTELIQSSPEAIEESVHSVIGGGYRKCNIVLQELRFNPMKRNRSGERDLDLMILSALWGMKRAILEYPSTTAGLIISLDRTFTPDLNAILVDKAIKYMREGIVGIDIAGPDRAEFDMTKYESLIEKARSAGLGITIHAGETGNVTELEYVVRTLKPTRIGHGIAASKSPELMKEIQSQGITLELCPTSNIRNSVVKDVDELRNTIRALLDHQVLLTINTDGPEMYQTNVMKEEEFLVSEGIMTTEEVTTCREQAFRAAFVRA